MVDREIGTLAPRKLGPMIGHELYAEHGRGT
jgi:hypothetical protein